MRSHDWIVTSGENQAEKQWIVKDKDVLPKQNVARRSDWIIKRKAIRTLTKALIGC